jgi:Protein of unknown function (DUF2806)
VNTDEDDQSDSDLGALEVIGNIFSAINHSVPVVVAKNLLKAVSRLSSAATDIPVAFLEGKAAEMRATTKGNVKLIKTTVDRIAAGMKVNPAYVHAAAEKYAQKIVRERVNIDLVTNMAIAEIANDASAAQPEVEPPPISDDWLNVFEAEAANMSSDGMRMLFGKILAGEIRKPSSYSIKTIKLMAQLDNQAAELFRLFCSLAISANLPQQTNILDARVVSLGNANANSLGPFGLGFGSLNVLQEYGLIITDYNSYMDYSWSVVHNNQAGIATRYAGKQWVFIPKEPSEKVEPFKVNGVALSKCGLELLPIIETTPNDAYTIALMEFLDKQGVNMTLAPPSAAQRSQR